MGRYRVSIGKYGVKYERDQRDQRLQRVQIRDIQSLIAHSMKTDQTTNGSPSALRQFCSDIATCAILVLPHIGIIFLLCVYTACAAGIFLTLERPHELEVRRSSIDDIHKIRDTMLKKMFDDIMKYGHDYEFDEWRSGIMDELDNFTRSLYTAYHIDKVAFDNIITNTSSTVWTWPQSIYFATTVITTIGNSNIVPRTITGRFLCIVFAMFGIPLVLLTIADLGKFMDDFIVYLYKKIRRIDSDIYLRLPTVIILVVFPLYLILGAALIHALEGWEYFDAFYFCFNTTAAIGAGDMIPSTPGIFITIAYIVIGMVVSKLCIDYATTEYLVGGW